MTYPPGGLDRAAASAARRLLEWASGRSTSDGTWIRALSAEVDEIETGWSQLAWALGVLPLVLVERVAALGRSWRPRLLWLASAGGLGARGVVILGTAVYFGATGSANISVAWLALGPVFVLPIAAVGAMCGLVGAALAYPTTTIRSLRTAAVRSLRGR